MHALSCPKSRLNNPSPVARVDLIDARYLDRRHDRDGMSAAEAHQEHLERLPWCRPATGR
jgi:hypothetical protein